MLSWVLRNSTGGLSNCRWEKWCYAQFIYDREWRNKRLIDRYRQTDRHRQTARQTDRQTDRQREKTETERERPRVSSREKLEKENTGQIKCCQSEQRHSFSLTPFPTDPGGDIKDSFINWWPQITHLWPPNANWLPHLWINKKSIYGLKRFFWGLIILVPLYWNQFFAAKSV